MEALLSHITYYFPNDYQKKPITVLDPAIGKGIFFQILIPLITSLVYSMKMYGLDIDSSLVKITNDKLNKLNQRFPLDFELKLGDFLLDYPSDLPRTFDVIIGNPPHNALYSQFEWTQIRKNCHFGWNRQIYSESSIFFTLKSLALLKVGGILCFLLPKPIIYSKRWVEFRKILLTDYKLVEVLDLGNQFSGQLQEQCAIIVKKENLDGQHYKYKTGIWNPIDKDFGQISLISNFDALMVKNLLVGVSASELEIIRRIYCKDHEFLNVLAFRGLSSKYRSKDGNIPLVEKSTISSGFLFPRRNFLHKKTPKQKLKRLKIPKIIAQRIISYHTKPSYSLDLKTWVDREGEILTNETVINIIPNYSREKISLYAVAGLLESSFIAWWLRHAVYVKEFVTSKDFDRAYINSIRIPHISGSKNHVYRKKLKKLLEENNYEEIMKQINSLPIIEKFYTLGEIYFKYQQTGRELKTHLDQIMKKGKFPLFNQRKSDFQNYKRLFHHLSRVSNSPIISGLQNAQYKKIMINYEVLKQLKVYINETVYSIYKITPNEEKIIKTL